MTKSKPFFERAQTRDARLAVRCHADLARLPALVVLERLPMPILAVEGCGAILFANKAIADLLGYRKASILEMALGCIIPDLPAEESVLPFLRTHSEQTVGLIHAKGSIIEAHMSASAMVREDDQIVLAGFLHPHNRWLAIA